MPHSSLFKRAFTLLLVVGLLDLFAEIFYFHWSYWWYDVILHFLGGFCVAMAFLSFYYVYFLLPSDNKFKTIRNTFLAVLVVGLIWEFYELVHGDTSLSDGIFYFRDTMSDLIADISGGFFGTLYSLKILKNK